MRSICGVRWAQLGFPPSRGSLGTQKVSATSCCDNPPLVMRRRVGTHRSVQIVQGTQYRRDVSFKGQDVQGTHYRRDVSFNGQNVQDLFCGDTSSPSWLRYFHYLPIGSKFFDKVLQSPHQRKVLVKWVKIVHIRNIILTVKMALSPMTMPIISIRIMKR